MTSTSRVLAVLVVTATACTSAERSTPDAGTDGGAIVCHATDAPSLSSCVEQANAQQIDEIAIDVPITCSGADACAINLVDSTRPLLVTGTTPTAALSRTDTADYSFVTITNSSHVTVSNLLLDDLPNMPEYAQPTPYLTASNAACHPASGSDCADVVKISGSSSVTLDHVTVQHAKRSALAMGAAQDVTITDCTFRDAFLLGVQLVDAANERITIENSLFEDIRSNPLVVQGRMLTVKHNTFRHDHHAAGWWSGMDTCSSNGSQTFCTANPPSSGGQLFIWNHVHDLVIDSNVIAGSQIDENIDPTVAIGQYGVQSSGIELDYAADLGQITDLSNLQITNNEIHDLSGVALTLPMEYVHDASVGLQFTGNTMYNLFVDPRSGIPIRADVRSSNYAGPLTYPFADNCYAASCPAPQPAQPPTPAAPSITSHGIGCAGGYGIYVIGAFPRSTWIVVLDAATNTQLDDYVGTGSPYAANGRTEMDNADGTRTLSFCLVTAAEKAALDGAGLRVFLTDPSTDLQANVTISRASP